MEWEIYHMIKRVETRYDEEKDELDIRCFVPDAKDHFQKLLDGATHAGLDFEGGQLDGQSVIGFQLRNANGEFYLAMRQTEWDALLQEPDTITFIYGEGEKEQFQTAFLNRLFEEFLDQIIAQYNDGDTDPFTLDIVHTFAEED